MTRATCTDANTDANTDTDTDTNTGTCTESNLDIASATVMSGGRRTATTGPVFYAMWNVRTTSLPCSQNGACVHHAVKQNRPMTYSGTELQPQTNTTTTTNVCTKSHTMNRHPHRCLQHRHMFDKFV